MNEELLLQRLEDLDGRLAELRERLPQSRLDERYDRRFYARLTNDALDTVIPAHIFTVEDALTAIERVKIKLGDLSREKQRAEERLAAEAIPGQLVFTGFAGERMKLAS